MVEVASDMLFNHRSSHASRTSVLLALFTDGRFMKKICLKRIFVIVCFSLLGSHVAPWLISSRLVSLNLGEYI